MKLKEIRLIFMDNKDRFEEIRKAQIPERSYKKIDVFETADELRAFLLDPQHASESIVVFLHIAASHGLEGLYSNLREEISESFPMLNINLITRNNTVIGANEIGGRPLFTYYRISERIKDGSIVPQLVSDLLHGENSGELHIDYGIITALYGDEFESIDEYFEWLPDTNTSDAKIRYKIGYLKTNPSKRVVATYQVQTGMVDAAVVATNMIEIYKPKYLLMPGVCGGAANMALGAIVVAKGVFSFQRGKISDRKDSRGNPISVIYTKDGTAVNILELYDEEQVQLRISIEDFERENDLINLDPALSSRILAAIPKIKKEIDLLYEKVGVRCTIEFEKMACSSMVINKSDYFNQNIKTIDRKTVAVEMESYGIAKACELANNGKTKFLIFKGVMDNTKDKTDAAKPNAAHMSALFLKYLLEGNHI